MIISKLKPDVTPIMMLLTWVYIWHFTMNQVSAVPGALKYWQRHTTLPPDRIAYTITDTDKCVCKHRCFVHPDCKAVTIVTNQTSGSQLCHFSNQKFLWKYFLYDESSFTLSNSKYCPRDYVEVGSQRLWINDCEEEKVGWNLADDMCKRNNGRLLSPREDNIDIITSYLKSNYGLFVTKDDIYKDLHDKGGSIRASSSSGNSYKAFSPDKKHESWRTNDIGFPQEIYLTFGDNDEQKCVHSYTMYAGDNLDEGPSKFQFWGSNDDDCSRKDTRHIISEDMEGTPFTHKDHGKHATFKNEIKYRCLGFTVLETPGGVKTTIRHIDYYYDETLMYFWIGGYRNETTDRLEWISGEEISTDDPRWIPGYPLKNRNYIELKWSPRTRHVGYKTVKSYKSNFICQENNRQ